MAGFLAAMAIVASIGAVNYRASQLFLEDSFWVSHTYEVLHQLDRVLTHLYQAESSARAHVLNGEATSLARVGLAEHEAREGVQSLSALTRDNLLQNRRVEALAALVDQRFSHLDELLERFREGGVAAAQASLRTGIGPRLSEQVRVRVSEIEKTERMLLATRSAAVRDAAMQASLFSVVGGAVSLGLIAVTSVLLWRDRRRRRAAEAELQKTNVWLSGWVDQLETRSREVDLLARLSQTLQACLDEREAHEVVVRTMPLLFGGTVGILALISNSRNLVEVKAAWGEATGASVFEPDDCWALRQGRAHQFGDGPTLRCPHCAQTGHALCVPLMAQGEALGVLSLRVEDGSDFPDPLRQLALVAAEQTALALANLQLRERLKIQSTHDPLTGLFNRRYLEESLEREASRSRRLVQPLAVLVCDIDHFKRFNDTFGHEAGDLVLRELGRILAASVRESDIACRWGGEEFVLVMCGISAEQAAVRANELRARVTALELAYRDQPLGTITLSVGVAGLPDHGNSGQALLLAADEALYRAKRSGRNCVRSADPGLSPAMRDQ